MKTITQLALGFSEDARVISFRKNHDAVSHPGPIRDTAMLFVLVLFLVNQLGLETHFSVLHNTLMLPDLVRNWQRLHGWFSGEKHQQERTLRDR